MSNTTQWVIDPMHSEIGFSVKHLMISTVKGKFATFSATAETAGDSFVNAKLAFEADINSIATGMEQRDAHLKSDNFFNAEAFPKLSFASTSVTSANGEDFTIEGRLTIRDVTLPVTLKAEFGGLMTDFYGQTKAGFEISGKISRKAFGLSWAAVTEAGGVVVSDDVRLMLDVQMTKQA